VRLIVWVLSSAVALSNCVPPKVPDTGCVVACGHLAKLGCEEGKGSCVEQCSEYELAGLGMNTGCLAKVEDCSATVDCALE